MTGESLYRMSPMEIALGWVSGWVDPLPPLDGPVPDPRTALEQAILPALQRPPCGVSFSGGRDSSTILAIAVDLARREGLPEPIALTDRFPDAPEADETAWQELVIDHLGLQDWVISTIHDEIDLIGPLATETLLRHGVLWPPLVASNLPAFEAVRGGSLLTGEHGDEVLGVEDHRIAPLTRLVRTPRSVRRRHLKALGTALAPAGFRARVQLADPEIAQPWLRPPAVETLHQIVDEEERRRPLDFAESLRLLCRERSAVLADHNEAILAADYDVQIIQPLGDHRVTEALAIQGGRLGLGDRTAVLRVLVGDLLPDALLTRTSKAEFAGTFMTGLTQAFAEAWDGEGLDEELVDAQMLRRIWRSGEHPGLSGALLQQAWLHSAQNSPENKVSLPRG